MIEGSKEDYCLKEEFRCPGAEKRSIPFWSWNGVMEEEEVRSQIRQMKEAGVGGFFIHSRIGLETEYLGTEWMNCVKAAVEEAREQGLYVWLYDEDRWPSGTAGGRVTSRQDAYRCKGLTLEIAGTRMYEQLYREEILGATEYTDSRIGLLAVYAGVIDGDRIIRYRRVAMQSSSEAFDEEEVLLLVRLEVSAPSEWFNNETPPDNLNPDCVKMFLQETHEKYRELIGDEFGKTVIGIFTDEPSLNDRFSYFGEQKSWIPWTYGFGSYFTEQTGYDFFDVLPLFYFHGKQSLKIRHDYWRCITQRYGECYFKVIGSWCENNHLLFTGHMLHEDSMGVCTRVNGAVMPHYQYMHVPGIDMLCEQTGEYMTVKQCTSVARQLGKKQVLTETYGCTGWDFTFEGQKWIGDWQYVLGVNRRCQHLMLYSLRGCRKRDYPPNFNYNTNWWTDNKIVDDYFARLSVVLETGDAVREVLVLHPASTAWSRLGVNPYGNPTRDGERDVPALDDYGQEFNGLIEYLERSHIDIDLGDELLIRQYGKAESAKLVIGEARYTAVVLPPLDTVFLSTCKVLLEYMEQGGYVYAMMKQPFLVDGSTVHENIYKELIDHERWITVDTKEMLIDRLEPYRTIRITDWNGEECKDVLYQLRKEGSDYYLFLVNNHRHEEKEIIVRLPFSAVPVEMDLLTGAIKKDVWYRYSREEIHIPVSLQKAGSVVYWLKDAADEITEHEEYMKYTGPFAYRMDHKNVLTLDRCRYRLEGDEWSEEMEVWKAQAYIRDKLDMRQIYSNGIEQRYKWIGTHHPQNGQKTELVFSFLADRCIEGAALGLERPEEFRVFLNGTEISWKTEGWLLDKEIKTCRLPKLKQGKNELLLMCAYRNDMELENIYLEGDFGVRDDRCLTELPQNLSIGSWTEQGLKHYCGSVAYLLEYTLEADRDNVKLRLKLPRTEAVCVKVVVNQQEIPVPWNFEQEVSIERWMHSGRNQIEVVVVGSPRNMMGPFHVKGKPYNTNADCFCVTGEYYSEEYLLVSYGIMGEILLIKERR